MPGFGAGARYVAGPPFFTGTAGVPVGWRGPGLAYYTDPGDLSAFVTHAQADALVASAAGVWNVPVAGITLGRGGTLAEHVSGANVYLGSGGMVYPDDVSSANSAARPIAVIYDADGSVTETLLGLGASSPSSCWQNAVYETVDQFDPAGYILHAIVVLNGRCTSTAAAAQLDLQYKLERVFGRVLGLAWSQANDNVFTGTPVATYAQASNWPVMHPVEIICGTYTYTCMPAPFTLRADDVASLVLVYPLLTAAAASAAGAGKVVSLQSAAFAYGVITFPTGEGMEGVNVLATRDAAGTATAEGWVTASGISGALFRRNGGSALVAADPSAWGSMGDTGAQAMGAYAVPYIPLPAGQSYANVHVRTEAINPLYTGQYSVGPYAAGAVTPSGSTPATQTATGVIAGSSATEYFAIADAASPCGNGLDGTATQPAAVDASGWWQGLLCGYGHASWMHLPVRAGRTFTVEVTALDAGGLATTGKAMPVMGLWGPGDAANALPTQGVSAAAFQGRGTGMTTLSGTTLSGTTGTITEMRLGIADQRGDGRPDYRFQGRFFYADSVLPVQVPAAGGTVTVTGYGFKAGNAVSVNGVAGTVTQMSATSLTVTVPAMSAAGAASGTAVDVKVADLSTGAVSTMTGALTYLSVTPSAETMKLVSAPVADEVVGSVAPVPFAVRVLQADGVTPVAGAQVVFTVSAGTASYGACGAASCTLTTDAQGLASTTVTPGSAGEITLVATDGGMQQLASFNGLGRDARMDLIEGPGGTQNVGLSAQPDFMVRVFGPDGSAPAAGRTITWTVTAGSAILSGCYAPVCATVTADNGVTSLTVTPLLPGTITVTASDGSLVQTVTFQAVLSLDTMTVTSVPSSPVYTGAGAGVFGVRLVTPNGYGDYYQPVMFSAPAGITFDACGGTNPCTVGTDSQGNTGSGVTASAAGTYTITATFGSGISAIAKTTTVTASVKTITRMRVVSVPSNNQAVGVYADKPFTVQVLQADGVTGAAYANVTLGGANGTMLLDCNRASCLMNADATGTASVRVIPLHAGSIALSAVSFPYSVAGSFTAVAAAKSMTVVAQPVNGTYVGDAATLTVQVLQPDGMTPAAGDTVMFSVGGGSFTFAGCSAACPATTDANGRASLTGSASAAGAVTLSAADGNVSQSFSFTTVGRMDAMQVVQAPAGKVTAGGFTAAPFQVRVLLADGVTPAAGRPVLFAVSVGYAGFGACAAANCTVLTDSKGLAQTTLYTVGPGAVTLEAIDTGAAQTAYVLASFTAVGAGDQLRVVSAPGNTTTLGNFEPQPLTFQVVGPDGATPVPGQSVTLATTAGNVQTTLCNGAPGCVAVSDAQGMVSTLVRPLTSGTVTMTASDGPVSQSVSFTVLRPPDTLTLIGGPADGSLVGGPAAVPMSVKVLQADGTVAAGRSVTIAVISGAATLGSCHASTCTLTADANGVLSTPVSPSAAGSVGILLTDEAVQLGYSFRAVARADALAVVSSPADGGLPGAVAAPAFTVRVTGGYAASAVEGRAVVFSVVSGSAALGCGSAVCTVLTDANGLASVAAMPGAAGSVVLQAADGALSVQTQFQVAAPHGLRLVSVPADGSFVGVAASPQFGVQAVLGDGVTPVAGDAVSVTVTNGTVCGQASCAGLSDAQGMVRMSVTPAAAGAVGVSAADGSAMVSASFNAVKKPDVLSLVSAPSGTATVGVLVKTPFAVRLVAGDGTARAGVAVVFSVSSGGASFGACPGVASCSVMTDASGLAATALTATAAGAVFVQAAAEGMTVSASFTAVDPPPDVLSLVSAPAGTATVGVLVKTPFAVRLIAGDGTARAGVAVMFSVGSGGASFGACSGVASCSVMTDATGMALTSLTATAAGAVSVQAAAEGMTVSASFTAVPAPDLFLVAQSPAASVYVGDSTGFAVRVLKADGSAPAAGVTVTFSAGTGSGQVRFDVCGDAVCAVTTDAQGLAATGVTGIQPGAVLLVATADTASRAGAVSAPLNVLANVYSLAFTGGGTTLFVAEGMAFRDGLAVTATRNGQPAGRIAVSWTATAGAGVGSSTSGVTDAAGVAGVSAALGPLAAGASGVITACAWTSICAEFPATGVAGSSLAIEVVSGGSQTVDTGQMPAALVGLVTDGAGHPVAGAAVTVFQTMYAGVRCPARGRCPAAAVLGTRASVLVSGVDGTVSLEPMSGAGSGSATETRVELTVGTSGVAAADVVVGG